jgi:cytosine/creatinine deaminase
MPIVDGDMWTECRMLMEACRFYNIDAVAEWACAKPLPAVEHAEPRRVAAGR